MWFHKSAKKDMLIYLLLGNTYREVFETEQMPLSVIDVFNGCSFTLVEGSTYKIVKSDESVNSFKIMDGVIPLATFYYGLGDQSENEIVRYVVSKNISEVSIIPEELFHNTSFLILIISSLGHVVIIVKANRL